MYFTLQRMRYLNRNTQRIARIIFDLCALLFIAFCFLYLYLLQPDYMGHLQNVLSSGATKYNAIIGAVLITLVLTVVGIIVHVVFRFPVRMLAWAWLPSVYLLTWLTSFSLGRLEVDSASPPYFLLILFPIIYILGIFFARSVPDHYNEHRSFGSYLLPNMLILFLSFLSLGVIADTSDSFHREEKAEGLLRKNLLEEVLLIGKEENYTSSRLFSMRSYSLCQLGRMGSELFNYPTSLGGSNDLLPEYVDTADVEDWGSKVYTLLGVDTVGDKPKDVLRFLEKLEQGDTLNNKLLREYLLSAYLLDRNLSAFSKVLSIGKDSSLYELPLHYREALVLEASFEGDSVMFNRDTVVASLFHQFDSIRSHDVMHRDATRKSFGKTYWYYFFYKQ